MADALVILAQGFEEVEAITVIDLLRRAEIEVTVAGLKEKQVTGSHKITVEADTTLAEVDAMAYDLLVLPGGQPGTTHLKEDQRILQAVKRRFESGRWLAAICAAPTVFHAAGITKGLKLTSYPSEKKVFKDSIYLEDEVVQDGKVVTSRGVGTAIPFCLKLIELLKGKNLADQIRDRIVFRLIR